MGYFASTGNLACHNLGQALGPPGTAIAEIAWMGSIGAVRPTWNTVSGR
jgi:hypothetical protein